MGKIVVSQFMTLDGVIEDPGGAEGFDRGGWAFRFERGEDGDAFKLDEVMSSDALLLGRRTFEGFAEAWPSREGEFAEKFNGMQKHVVSTTLRDPELEQLPGDRGRRRRRGPEAAGGAGWRHPRERERERWCSFLLDRGLIDELRLMVFPIVLGEGKRLFPDGIASTSLRLEESRPAGETIILIYVPKAPA